MPLEWVVAYTAAGQLNAQIIKSLLEAAEIPVQTAQEGAGAVYAFTIGPMGEVDVLVPADRLPEAQAIIAAYQNGELDDGDSDLPGLAANAPDLTV